jgi:hypothetical protein
VNVADEPDHERARQVAPCRTEDARVVDLEDFGLLIDDEPEGPPYWQDGQRLE